MKPNPHAAPTQIPDPDAEIGPHLPLAPGIGEQDRVWLAFARAVDAEPDRVAIETAERIVTRRGLAGMANELMVALAGAGVRPHDTVVLLVPNSVSFVAAFLALNRMSAIAALASPRYRATELRAIGDAVRPAAVVAAASLADEAARALRATRRAPVNAFGLDEPLQMLAMPEGAPARDALWHQCRARDEDATPALIKFSSGSTGAPKAILWSAANVEAEAHNVIDTLGLRPPDTVLSPVPLSHSYGFDLGVLPAIYGAASLILRGLAPKGLVRNLAEQPPSAFLGVPGVYRVLNRCRLDTVPDLSGVRHLLSCTAPLPPDVIESFERRFRGNIRQHYGSSETGGVTMQTPNGIASRPSSVGLAMPNVAVRIEDAAGDPRPTGSVGEVVVESQTTAMGYVVDGALATDEAGEPGRAFRRGAYRTGDTGFVDADGYLYIVGARADLINVDGLKVSPVEVTKTLEEHAAVREAAVIGVRGAEGQVHVVAAVALEDGQAIDEHELLGFCQARLADYKVPRRVHVVDHLPRNATGDVTLRAEDLPG